MTSTDPLPDTVREFFAYDPIAGSFAWAKPYRGRKAGDPAGTYDRGYWRLKLHGRLYLAHRIACLLVHGRDPVHSIGHRDGDPLNNKLLNLHETTKLKTGKVAAPHRS